jgi:hypothetical protein
MNLRAYRAFSTELLKIANDLGDAKIRALLADRRGEEYLKGGELDSDPENDERPAIANIRKTANIAALAPSFLRAHKKDDSAYQTVRDTSVKALGGAAGGAGAVKLFHDMAGKAPTPRAFRLGAGAGVGLALADKAYRYRQEIGDKVRRKPKPKTKTAFVQQQPGTTFRSPAESLSSASQVGKFQNRVHQSAAKVPGILGKAFRTHLV